MNIRAMSFWGWWDCILQLYVQPFIYTLEVVATILEMVKLFLEDGFQPY